MTTKLQRVERTEAALLTAAVVLFVGLRWLVASRFAVELVHHEEFFSLRLARQLAAGLPVGELRDYWFTGISGGTGGGAALLALLEVPVYLVLRDETTTLRVVAVAHSAMTYLACIGIGGALRGLRGRLGVAAAGLMIPPSWLWFGVIAKGNYVESAAWAMVCCWLTLRARDGARGAATLASAVAAVSGWAHLTGLIVAGWFVATTWTWRRTMSWRGALAGATAAFVACGLLPMPEPGGHPFAVGDYAANARSILVDPASWPRFLVGVWSGIDVDPRPWVVRGDPDAWGIWERAVPLGMTALVSAWLAVAARRRRPPDVAVAALAALFAVGLPIGYGLIGAGPENLSAPALWGFDPRRLAAVYPCWAIALGVTLAGLPRWPGRLTAGLGIALGVGGGLEFAGHGAPPPEPFRPYGYVVCPAGQPRDETDVCVERLDRAWVPAIERYSEVLAGEPVAAQRAALEAWGRVSAPGGCERPAADAVSQRAFAAICEERSR